MLHSTPLICYIFTNQWCLRMANSETLPARAMRKSRRLRGKKGTSVRVMSHGSGRQWHSRKPTLPPCASILQHPRWIDGNAFPAIIQWNGLHRCKNLVTTYELWFHCGQEEDQPSLQHQELSCWTYQIKLSINMTDMTLILCLDCSLSHAWYSSHASSFVKLLLLSLESWSLSCAETGTWSDFCRLCSLALRSGTFMWWRGSLRQLIMYCSWGETASTADGVDASNFASFALHIRSILACSRRVRNHVFWGILGVLSMAEKVEWTDRKGWKSLRNTQNRISRQEENVSLIIHE